jgi:hypothetical protein
LGGARCRLLSSLEAERRRGWQHATLANQVDRFIEFVPLWMVPAVANLWPREMPAQQKMPINFVRPGFRYWNSHSSSNTKLSRELVALRHLKFCQELSARMKMVERSGNHYRRGVSYFQLKQALGQWPARTLMYEGSRKFRESRDFEVLGLIGPRSSELWLGQKIKEFLTEAAPARQGRGRSSLDPAAHPGT